MNRPEKEQDFEFSGGELCLDFTNTIGDHATGRNEQLDTYADLLAWGRQSGAVSAGGVGRLQRAASRNRDEAEDVFRGAKEVRGCLFRIFSALAGDRTPASRDVSSFNDRLNAILPRLRVVRAAEGYEWSWAGPADALDRMLWPVLRSAADLLTSEKRTRVRECNSDSCTWLFIDRSPAGRRRWCDMSSCGNRQKARRHYHRKKSARGRDT